MVTVTTGVLCTFALATVSPAARTFLESWSTEVSIGAFDSVKALYVLIPLAIAIVSRVFLLHDKISDLLGIRRRFDLENILKPLAEGVGISTDGSHWKRVEENRKLTMTRTFYRFASFREPKIDVQLVRTAADRWAWFWCTVEPLVILLIAGLIFAVLGAWSWAIGILVSIAVLILIGLLLWPQLRRGASYQVAEILNNENWRAELHTAFHRITEGNGAAAEAGRCT